MIEFETLSQKADVELRSDHDQPGVQVEITQPLLNQLKLRYGRFNANRDYEIRLELMKDGDHLRIEFQMKDGSRTEHLLPLPHISDVVRRD